MYISLEGNKFGFKDPDIHEILPTDVQISDEIYNRYFELQSQGKQFKINNINGVTFEEIFEEVIPEPPGPQPKTEVELLKDQLATMQGALDFIIMNY